MPEDSLPRPRPDSGRAVFLDPGLDAALDEAGYVVVPLLPPGDVAALRARFLELLPTPGYGSHYTSSSPDPAFREAVFVAIRDAFAPALADLLDGYRPVVANFFAKEPAAGTSMVIHQDWAFVDEARCRSVNVWCPLEDASVENGTLHVLPGSHRTFDNLRGTAVAASGLPSPFAGIEAYATERYLQPVPVPAGSAIVNDHRLVHSSPDNRSGRLRVAASLTLVPAEEPVRHYFGDGDGRVDLYEIEDAVLRSHRIGAHPAGRLTGTMAYERPPFGPAQLDALLTGRSPAATTTEAPPSDRSSGTPGDTGRPRRLRRRLARRR